ncbi:MAG: hypothetical protein ABEJ99_01245 [Candidatus Nanohaloarchaea archaeon]
MSKDNGSEAEKYGFAAILSFFMPGLGQIVKGQIWKGIGLMLGAVISVGLMMVVIGFIMYPVIWIYSIYDAYNNEAPA